MLTRSYTVFLFLPLVIVMALAVQRVIVSVALGLVPVGLLITPLIVTRTVTPVAFVAARADAVKAKIITIARTRAISFFEFFMCSSLYISLVRAYGPARTLPGCRDGGQLERSIA